MGKRVVLRFRPMALTVGGEREAIYGALKAQLAELQRMANDGGLPVKVRLQAMGLAVQERIGQTTEDLEIQGAYR